MWECDSRYVMSEAERYGKRCTGYEGVGETFNKEITDKQFLTQAFYSPEFTLTDSVRV